MTKLFNKYIKMLEKDMLTENELIQLKSRISGMRYSLTDNEVDHFRNKVLYGDCEYNITSEHTLKGISYLKEKLFKRNGKRRNTKLLENNTPSFFQAVKDFDCFTFVGFHEVQIPLSSRSLYSQVWRIYTTKGEYFDYCMGMNLEFIELDRNVTENFILIK